MRFNLLAVTLGLLALTNALAIPDDDLPSTMENAAESLNKHSPRADAKACKSNGCACKKGTKGGKYCGCAAEVVDLGSGGDVDHIYQCDGAKCCDYGFNMMCKRIGPSCPDRG